MLGAKIFFTILFAIFAVAIASLARGFVEFRRFFKEIEAEKWRRDLRHSPPGLWAQAVASRWRDDSYPGGSLGIAVFFAYDCIGDLGDAHASHR